MGVGEEDNLNDIRVDGFVDGVKAHIDLEDAAGCVGAENDVAFIFVQRGDKNSR